MKPSLERNLKAIDFDEYDLEEHPTFVAKYRAREIRKFFHMAYYNVENWQNRNRDLYLRKHLTGRSKEFVDS